MTCYNDSAINIVPCIINFIIIIIIIIIIINWHALISCVLFALREAPHRWLKFS